MVITGNYVHSTYNSFARKHYIILYVFLYFCLYIQIFTVKYSVFIKCLIAIKCSERGVEILQFFMLSNIEKVRLIIDVEFQNQN